MGKSHSRAAVTQVRRSHLPFVWLLLAAALLLRAAVPAGWMPTAGHDGVRIALCTGMGTEFLTLGADGHLHKEAPKPDSPKPNTLGDPCPFGLASAQAADLPPIILLPEALARLDAVVSPSFAQAARIARRSLRPPARGPPTLA